MGGYGLSARRREQQVSGGVSSTTPSLNNSIASPGVLVKLTPHSSAGGFHARNNPFQEEGPVGFVEQKALPNNEVYVRIDLPGVVENHFSYIVHEDKKLVFLEGSEGNIRTCSTFFGLACDCCEISGVEAQLRDGVLRMLLKKARLDNKKNPAASSVCDHHLPVVFETLPSGHSSGTASDEIPYVLEGLKTAFFTSEPWEGALFMRIDMPGMVEEDLKVFIKNGELRFMGTTRTYTHDSGPRKYLGAVCPIPPIHPIGDEVIFQVEDGVLRMMIPFPS